MPIWEVTLGINHGNIHCPFINYFPRSSHSNVHTVLGFPSGPALAWWHLMVAKTFGQETQQNSQPNLANGPGMMMDIHPYNRGWVNEGYNRLLWSYNVTKWTKKHVDSMGFRQQKQGPKVAPTCCEVNLCRVRVSCFTKILDMGGFQKGCTPIAGWFTLENPSKMDDLGVTHFRKPLYFAVYLNYAPSSPLSCYWFFNHLVRWLTAHIFFAMCQLGWSGESLSSEHGWTLRFHSEVWKLD